MEFINAGTLVKITRESGQEEKSKLSISQWNQLQLHGHQNVTLAVPSILTASLSTDNDVLLQKPKNNM